jgi:hypothetical protein
LDTSQNWYYWRASSTLKWLISVIYICIYLKMISIAYMVRHQMMGW